jgi:UTP:GlnB (protein PII) uridylyltransferase
MYQKGSLSVENEVEKIWAKTSQKAKGDIIKSVKVFRRSKNIVVEILAFDCRGILFKIAKKIRERGYEIVFARVNTEHSFGRNTFYIRKPKP